MQQEMTREEIRAALTGPFGSVRTPFLEDGGIDYDGLRSVIDFNIDGGSKTVLLTAGDSNYLLLSDEEILKVTQVAAEHTAGRAMVVAADRYYWTGRSVEFGRQVRQMGADVLMVLPPDWASSCTAQTLSEHFAAVAEEIPVMVVTNIFSPRGMEFGLETLKVLLQQVPGIVAIKDDFCGQFARRMSLLVHEHWAVFSGGQKQNHLDLHPYGCDGYLSTFASYCPRVAHEYWDAIQAGNIEKARQIVETYDMPLFDYLPGLTGGFDAGMHGMLELYGIAQRWRRKPYYSLNDEEMDALKSFLQGLSVL